MKNANLTRAVRIVLEVDPDRVPVSARFAHSHMVATWQGSMTLRLLPCKGGVAIVRGGRERAIHSTPGLLARRLQSLAMHCACVSSACTPHTATWRYHEDRARFYSIAATAVETDPRCLRLWGLA